MSDDQELKPRCCSECLYFDGYGSSESGYCYAPQPWWRDPDFVNNEIRIPEYKAKNCLCFFRKP